MNASAPAGLWDLPNPPAAKRTRKRGNLPDAQDRFLVMRYDPLPDGTWQQVGALYSGPYRDARAYLRERLRPPYCDTLAPLPSTTWPARQAFAPDGSITREYRILPDPRVLTPRYRITGRTVAPNRRPMGLVWNLGLADALDQLHLRAAVCTERTDLPPQRRARVSFSRDAHRVRLTHLDGRVVEYRIARQRHARNARILKPTSLTDHPTLALWEPSDKDVYPTPRAA